MPFTPRRSFTLQARNRALPLGRRTLVMGILNVTPDSFSERGTYFDRKGAVARALEMEREGADILDIGGESTRPAAEPVSAEEELDRTIPVIESLARKGIKIPVSIDTYKAVVAERALRAGVEIVNDVSGLRYDSAMAAVVRKYGAGLVLMHLRGTPQTMQGLPPVRRIVPAVLSGLTASLRRAHAAGIAGQQIVLDPGIGFGKTVDQNYELLTRGLPRLARMGYPILVGPSRKSFIRKALESGMKAARPGSPITPEEIVFGTAAAVTVAVLNGAHIVRVHDVIQMLSAVRLADRILE